jgi:hypothetical protein
LFAPIGQIFGGDMKKKVSLDSLWGLNSFLVVGDLSICQLSQGCKSKMFPWRDSNPQPMDRGPARVEVHRATFAPYRDKDQFYSKRERLTRD